MKFDAFTSANTVLQFCLLGLLLSNHVDLYLRTHDLRLISLHILCVLSSQTVLTMVDKPFGTGRVYCLCETDKVNHSAVVVFV